MTVRKVKKRSAIPLYGAAAAWALGCLLLPTFKLWHFLAPSALAVAAYIILGRVFPGAVEYVEEAQALAGTGDEALDALLRGGEEAIAEMLRYREAAGDFRVKAKIAEIADISVKIFKDVIEDPADYAQVRRFADIFMPETLRILKAYTQLEASGAGGTGVEAAKSSAADVLDTIIASYKKQYDALFANQAIDIETDIKVLETMLKREGLTDGDF
ncbi:MAG: 5-bromo-4-chloroindolyl phosphate hydrolysis family protein [Oscillospiraceae bacterium]|nr:5-bromo-4-chloroindolyl phosphate hydrolysis family protein [Oscillospiraceae bacterium]